jgi:outer membrane immunogenic protein
MRDVRCLQRIVVMVRLSSFVVAGVFAAFGLLLIAQSAVAADMPDFLRGSYTPTNTRWDGVYFGAQVGVANMNTDFGNAASQLFGNNLSNTTLDVSSWALMPTNTITGQSYGAFLGYNVQWEELVLGFDMAYNHMSSMASSSSAGSINRTVTTSDGTYLVNISGQQASNELIDYATLRGRAGYAFGQFLPYVVVGAAIGRFDYTTTANLQVCGPDFPDTVCSTSTTTTSTTSTTGTNTTGTTGTNTTSTTGTSTTGTPSTTSIKSSSASLSNSKNNAIVAGFVGGLGMDVALLPNVFLRGEWEFVAFAPVSGIRANLNTVRVGIAVKF